MDMKKYLLDKIQSQAIISVMKYRHNNNAGAGAYFHSAANFGKMYEDFFNETDEYASTRYIEIMQKVCEYWGVDYRTWFDTMCDIVY